MLLFFGRSQTLSISATFRTGQTVSHIPRDGVDFRGPPGAISMLGADLRLGSAVGLCGFQAAMALVAGDKTRPTEKLHVKSSRFRRNLIYEI